jgi:hypothetical protein
MALVGARGVEGEGDSGRSAMPGTAGSGFGRL